MKASTFYAEVTTITLTPAGEGFPDEIARVTVRVKANGTDPDGAEAHVSFPVCAPIWGDEPGEAYIPAGDWTFTAENPPKIASTEGHGETIYNWEVEHVQAWLERFIASGNFGLFLAAGWEAIGYRPEDGVQEAA